MTRRTPSCLCAAFFHPMEQIPFGELPRRGQAGNNAGERGKRLYVHGAVRHGPTRTGTTPQRKGGSRAAFGISHRWIRGFGLMAF